MARASRLIAGTLLASACACRGGGDSAGPARVDELERRVARLEARLAGVPADESALAGAPVEELVERLAADDPLARFAAGRALAPRVAEARPHLVRLLRDGSPRQREAAAAVFATGEPLPDSAFELVEAHGANPDARVRAWLDVALARTGRTEAFDPLVADLSHPATRVRLVAIRGLVDLRDGRAAVPLLKASRDGDPFVAGTAREALREMGGAAVAFFETGWTALGPRERQDAVAAIGGAEDEAVEPFLVGRLADASPLVGLEAALALARRRSDAGRELALERLGSDDPVIARAAREVLDALGPDADPASGGTP